MADVARREGGSATAQFGRRPDCESLPGEPGALHQAFFRIRVTGRAAND